MSHSDFLPSKLIGNISIGMKTLYVNKDHTFQYEWLALTHPDDPKQHVTGYIQVSAYLIGEQDNPPAVEPKPAEEN